MIPPINMEGIRIDTRKVGANTNIRVMTINCRSIVNKIVELHSIVDIYNPDILVCVETWLDPNILTGELECQNYNYYRRDRNRHGGGVMVGVKDTLISREQWSDDLCEIMCVGVKIKLNHNYVNLNVIALYRPPGNDNEETLERLVTKVESYSETQMLLIAGDFNLPNVRWSPGGEFLGKQGCVNTLMNLGLIQTVTEGTRVSASGLDNILDIVLVRPENLWFRTDIVSGISDHKIPIVDLILIGYGVHNLSDSKIKIRDYKKVNSIGMKSFFDNAYESWETTNVDVQSLWDGFLDIFNNAIDKYIPSKIIAKSKDPPYFNKEIKKLKRIGRKMYNKTKCKNQSCKKSSINAIRKKLDTAKKVAKDKYMLKMFNTDDKQGSWNKMYKHIKSQGDTHVKIPALLGENEEACTDYDKAEALNKQYSSVYQINTESMDGSSDNLQDVYEAGKYDQFRISYLDIMKVIRKLKNGKAAGPDGINNRIIKLAAVGIVPYLRTLFQLSINNGQLPTEWKLAHVIPIFKSGERCRASNYRPVSLTSAICKILEKLVCKYLNSVLVEHLSEAQHGFRQYYSCETQLLALAEDLNTSLDKGKETDAIFIDMAKAFDIVPHNRLIKKLSTLIEDKILLAWISDFLKDRTQQVKVGNSLSKPIRVTSGVPQGSVLGPMLFNVFINDITDGVTSKVRLYADDCALYRTIHGTEDELALQCDLDRICSWVKDNNMKLNVDKCVSMCFSRKINVRSLQYTMEEKSLKIVTNFKYLGVTLNNKLDWGEQVRTVAGKSIKTLNFVMRNLTGACEAVKEKAYLSLIRPIAEYASIIWDPYVAWQVAAIEGVQRLAARKVKGKMRRFKWVQNKKGDWAREYLSPTAMVKSLGWKTLEARRKGARLGTLFKIGMGKKGWSELSGKLQQGPVRGDHHWKLLRPGARTNLGNSSFIHRTISDWNKLPIEMFREMNSINCRIFRDRVINDLV